MKSFFTLFILFLLLNQGFLLFAGNDEGMWLPLYIRQLNEKKMKQLGMNLSAEDIYAINHASIKDAVLRLGDGFCTGELVSPNGLVFTNHHCGYEAIAELSTVQNDFLTNGYWADSFEKEIPIPNLTVSRLVSMRDVTEMIEKATAGISNDKLKTERINEIGDSLVKVATFDTHYDAELKSFFGDNQYFLLVYETFKDVRFVGAPPSSIGKFGGDTDNWMWPRHTGDFSVLRVYVGPDGEPAVYSKQNVPYKPLKYLPISLKGINYRDFTMTLGYPAQTERYLTSYDIHYMQEKEQPAIIAMFGMMLKVMKEDMDKDPQVKLNFASDYASYNNTFKYYEGQNLGLRKEKLINTYEEKEKKFDQWVNSDPDRKDKYGDLLNEIKNANLRFESINPGFTYIYDGVFRLNTINHLYAFVELLDSFAIKSSKENIKNKIAEMRTYSDNLFDKKLAGTEKKILANILVMFYHDVSNASEMTLFKYIMKEGRGKNPDEKIYNYIEHVYSSSVLLNKTRLEHFYKKPGKKPLLKDPALKMLDYLIDIYSENYAMIKRSTENTLDNLHSRYIAALMKWQKDKVFYPDANSTMRMSYGKVLPYYPRDGVYYDYKTTYLGILQKENPKDEEFVVPARLHELFVKKDFGRYAKNDTLYICFLTDNDISGGNSGSPVINADGQLIGLAFDGDWEAMTSDLIVDPRVTRTIVVDIRYVLFIIDKFAGDTRLIKELKIIE